MTTKLSEREPVIAYAGGGLALAVAGTALATYATTGGDWMAVAAAVGPMLLAAAGIGVSRGGATSTGSRAAWSPESVREVASGVKAPPPQYGEPSGTIEPGRYLHPPDDDDGGVGPT